MGELSERSADFPRRHVDPLGSLALPPDEWTADEAYYQQLSAGAALHPTESNATLARHLVFRMIYRAVVLSQPPESELLAALQNHVLSLPISWAQRAYLRELIAYVGLPSEWWVPVLSMGLVGFAAELERDGLVREALVTVALGCRCYRRGMDSPTFLYAGLLTGRLHRRLGQWDAAEQAYVATRDAATEIGDPRSALKATNGMIASMMGRGNLPGASDLAEATLAQTPTEALRSTLALTYGMLAAVRDRQDRLAEAIEAGRRAAEWQDDAEARVHAVGELGCFFARVGDDAGARGAFETVLRDSRLWLTRTNAQIEVMAIDIRAGNELNFRAAVRGLVAVDSQMPPAMQVDFRVQSAVGWRRFGPAGTAAALLRDAMRIAEAAHLAQWVFRIEGLLEGKAAPDPRGVTADELAITDAQVSQSECAGEPLV